MPRAYSARGYDVRALCVTQSHRQSAWSFILLIIVSNAVARVTSKRWLAEWLALSKYVKSLEIRWLAL